VPTFFPAPAVFSQLALVVGLTAMAEAAPQPPGQDLPVSLDRIRDGVTRTSSTRLKVDMPVEVPVAVFKTHTEQQVYVLSLDEWLDKEFTLTALQRQSAEWAGKCCGIGLGSLFNSVEDALQRRRVRKIREQIARELAEIEADRKKAALSKQR
jgi:hypothetical protein